MDLKIADITSLHRIQQSKDNGVTKMLKTLGIIDYFNPKDHVTENPHTGLSKQQPFALDLDYFDVDDCKYGFNYRTRPRLWTNMKTWAPRPLCKKDCGKARH